MAEFSVNVNRHDPYKQYKFRVVIDGKNVPGVCRVSGLKRTTEVITQRSGGSASITGRSPGMTVYEPIHIIRGRTHDPEFEHWANKVWSLGAGQGTEVSLKDFRKDIIIELFNEAGQTVMAFKVYRCWPSEYEAISALDANETAVALESITLQHEGWERDAEIKEPNEPSFTRP